MKRLLLILYVCALASMAFAKQDPSNVFEVQVHSLKTEHVKINNFAYCGNENGNCELDTYWDYFTKDGHQWIAVSSRYNDKRQIEIPIQVIHDPNCPCQKRRDQWMQNIYEGVNKLYNFVKTKLK